jgi:rsbT antagonist protein RsbS
MEHIPIIKMGSNLLVTIQVDMHDELALTLQDALTGRIAKEHAMGVLIDISSLDLVDSFMGRMIANISAMARVLDARTVVVGMQPAVAITLVELGLRLEGVFTALNVEKGMALLEKQKLVHRPEGPERTADRGARPA